MVEGIIKDLEKEDRVQLTARNPNRRFYPEGEELVNALPIDLDQDYRGMKRCDQCGPFTDVKFGQICYECKVENLQVQVERLAKSISHLEGVIWPAPPER